MSNTDSSLAEAEPENINDAIRQTPDVTDRSEFEVKPEEGVEVKVWLPYFKDYNNPGETQFSFGCIKVLKDDPPDRKLQLAVNLAGLYANGSQGSDERLSVVRRVFSENYIFGVIESSSKGKRLYITLYKKLNLLSVKWSLHHPDAPLTFGEDYPQDNGELLQIIGPVQVLRKCLNSIRKLGKDHGGFSVNDDFESYAITLENAGEEKAVA